MDFIGIGLPELLVILVIALIVVGPNKLPEMAAQLARLFRAARRYGNQVTKDFNEALHELEEEYDEMKGEWKEVGKGLDESVKEISDELKSVDEETRKSLDGTAPRDGLSEPSEPSRPDSSSER